MGHRQEILRPERRCVGLVRGGRHSVRDSSATAPIFPCVLNACATVLRGSGRYGMTRAGHPGKRLCRTVSRAVNAES